MSSPIKGLSSPASTPSDNAVSLYAYRNGGFSLVGSLATGSLPAQIVSADLNGDGRDDLVVRNAGDGTLTVFFSNGSEGDATGNALFPRSVTLRVGIGVSDVALVNTTGSGLPDIVVTNKLTGLVSVIRNHGGGIFGTPVPYRAGTGLLASDNSGSVTSMEATAGVAAGRSRREAPTDLVTVNPGSNTLGLLAGLGGGRFANPVDIPTAEPAQVVRVADFNHDGIPDVAVLGPGYGEHLPGERPGGLLRRRLLQRRPRPNRPDRRRRQRRRQSRPARRQHVRRRPGAGGQGRRHVPAATRDRPATSPWPWPT